MRTFVALGVAQPVRKALGVLAAQMAMSWPQGAVRWVPPAKVHLTLRFLGDTAEEYLPCLREGLDRIGSECPPFELHLGRLGCFPHARRPRVLWVELCDPAGRLGPLHRAVERLARALGWEQEERAFRPHLTLGRVRERARPPQGAWRRPPPALSFEARELILFESRLQPGGAEYAALHRSALAQ